MELYHNTKLSFPVQHLAVEHLSSSFFLVFGFWFLVFYFDFKIIFLGGFLGFDFSPTFV
jgi:hypothetical protein